MRDQSLPRDPVWRRDGVRLADEHLQGDPCQTIRCPSDCWSCRVTPDGIGTCVVDNDKCQQVTVTVGQKGGGNGCSCEVGGSTGASPLALLLGFALVFARRRRR